MDVVAASNLPMNLEPIAASPPPAKRRRFVEDLNRVSEIVLVLSALGRIRGGGKTPTEAEIELMVEARSKLAMACQGQRLTPKDIIGSDDCVRNLIEDLGLNCKIKDHRFGFGAKKLTISEKISLGKRKMEEAENYAKPKVYIGYDGSSQLSGSVVSPGLAKNVSLTHQCEATNVNTNGSHYRMERSQMMLNGASHGTSISSANYYATSWSATDKKVPVQSSARVTDPSFRPFMSQTPHGTFSGTYQSLQGMHCAQTPSYEDNHVEIAKIVHKALQPKVKKNPLWNQASRYYMSIAVACQMCEVTINEVETLLVCDACEKAYHLKCLQGNSMQGAPKSEWHCSKCVQLFNGRAFPPKYGCTIAATTSKVPFTTEGVHSSIAKKVGSIEIKGNQPKPILTTSPGVQNSPAQVALTENPNLAAIASTSSVTNNGLVPKPLTPVGTMSSAWLLPVGNQVTANITSNATPSTPIAASLIAQAPTVIINRDSSSSVSGTADHSVLNTYLTTEVNALTVTLSGNSKPGSVTF
ncbi:unnamed protein product [Cochlearia groenlandica]